MLRSEDHCPKIQWKCPTHRIREVSEKDKNLSMRFCVGFFFLELSVTREQEQILILWSWIFLTSHRCSACHSGDLRWNFNVDILMPIETQKISQKLGMAMGSPFVGQCGTWIFVVSLQIWKNLILRPKSKVQATFLGWSSAFPQKICLFGSLLSISPKRYQLFGEPNAPFSRLPLSNLAFKKSCSSPVRFVVRFPVDEACFPCAHGVRDATLHSINSIFSCRESM